MTNTLHDFQRKNRVDARDCFKQALFAEPDSQYIMTAPPLDTST